MQRLKLSPLEIEAFRTVPQDQPELLHALATHPLGIPSLRQSDPAPTLTTQHVREQLIHFWVRELKQQRGIEASLQKECARVDEWAAIFAAEAKAGREMPPTLKRFGNRPIPPQCRGLARCLREAGVLRDNLAQCQARVAVGVESRARLEGLDLGNSKYPTKVDYLLTYVKRVVVEQPLARFLVFSGHSFALSTLKRVFEEESISVALLKGNVHMRDSAIGAFRTALEDSDSVSVTAARVLLMPLDQSASGSDLPHATHVVFFDAARGTRKEVRATESQAIGRAHRQGQLNRVQVLRLLALGTEDEATFDNTHEATTHSSALAPAETLSHGGFMASSSSSSCSSEVSELDRPPTLSRAPSHTFSAIRRSDSGLLAVAVARQQSSW